MNREPVVEVLARAMCGVGGWGAWDRFSEMQRDQIRSEAQQCIEALQSAGWVIIAQATQEEFDAAQRELAKGYERLADYDRTHPYGPVAGEDDPLGDYDREDR